MANWKVFVFNLCAIMLMVFLQHMHLKPPAFVHNFQEMISPIPGNGDVFGGIKLKLMQKDDHFEIKKSSSLVPSVYAAAPYENAAAFAVVDLDNGQLLQGKNTDQKLPIASLTKIMTAVVALDLASPDELFTVSKHASNMEPTKIGVVPGQKMSLDELLHAALMTSANDAVEVIKEGIDQKYAQDTSLVGDGTTSDFFVKAMNEKAQFLGLKNSHFQNPQGFDSASHYSSADDLAKLSEYALENYPLIDQIVQKDYFVLQSNQNHKKFDLYNWNSLIGVYPGAYGVKIGNTDNAGKTMVVASQREGKRVMTVVLNAPTIQDRDLWAADLLDDGFSQIAGLKPAAITLEQLKAKYQTWKYWN